MCSEAHSEPRESTRFDHVLVCPYFAESLGMGFQKQVLLLDVTGNYNIGA